MKYPRTTISISIIASVILIVTFLNGCAGMQERPSIISISKNAIDTAAASHNLYKKIVITLYKDGLIGEAEKKEAIKLSEEFDKAYHLAVNTLAAYKKVKSAVTDKEVDKAIAEMSKLLADFIGYIQPYVIKKEDS